MGRTYVTGKRLMQEEGKRVREYKLAILGSADISSGGSSRPQPTTAPTPNSPLPMNPGKVPQRNYSKPNSPLSRLIGSDPITWSPSKTASEPMNYQPPKQQPGSFDAGDPGYSFQHSNNTRNALIVAAVVVLVYYIFVKKD